MKKIQLIGIEGASPEMIQQLTKAISEGKINTTVFVPGRVSKVEFEIK